MNTPAVRRWLSPLLLAYLFALLPGTAYADLMLSPTRVEFGPRERSAQLTLLNTSDKVRSYKIAFRQQRQLTDGRYQLLDPAASAAFPAASPMIRFSPRQVILQPGERQLVRLSLRRPQGLADGEYRSHLVFEAQPPAEEPASDSEDSEDSFSLQVSISFSIPVIVRQGQLQTGVTLQPPQLLSQHADGKLYTGARIELWRRGQSSAYGNLKLYWRPEDSRQERLVGQLNQVAIYPEASHRRVQLGFEQLAPQDGQLRVVFEGAGEFTGQIFDERTYQVAASDFTALAAGS